MIFKGLTNEKFPLRVTSLRKQQLSDTRALPFQDFSFPFREKVLGTFRAHKTSLISGKSLAPFRGRAGIPHSPSASRNGKSSPARLS